MNKTEKKIDLILKGINLLVINDLTIAKDFRVDFNRDFSEIYIEEIIKKLPYAESLVENKIAFIEKDSGRRKESSLKYKNKKEDEKIVLVVYKNERHTKDNISHYMNLKDGARFDTAPEGYKIIHDEKGSDLHNKENNHSPSQRVSVDKREVVHNKKTPNVGLNPISDTIFKNNKSKVAGK